MNKEATERYTEGINTDNNRKKKHKIKGYVQHRDALSGPTQSQTETKDLFLKKNPSLQVVRLYFNVFIFTHRFTAYFSLHFVVSRFHC